MSTNGQTVIHTDTLKKAEQDIAAGFAASQQENAPGMDASSSEEPDFSDVAPPPPPEKSQGRRRKTSTATPSAPAEPHKFVVRTVPLTDAEQDAALADVVRLSRRNQMMPGDYVNSLRHMVVAWDLMIAAEEHDKNTP